MDIKTENVDGKECYALKYRYIGGSDAPDETFYVEKESGLVLKMVYVYENNGITKENILKYEYGFGTVTAEDMKEPNASEYVVKDTTK